MLPTSRRRREQAGTNSINNPESSSIGDESNDFAIPVDTDSNIFTITRRERILSLDQVTSPSLNVYDANNDIVTIAINSSDFDSVNVDVESGLDLHLQKVSNINFRSIWVSTLSTIQSACQRGQVSSFLTPCIEQQEQEKIWKPALVLGRTYRAMYFVGVAKHDSIDSVGELNFRKTSTSWIHAVIYSLLFWLVTSLSIFHSACQAKFCFLRFLSGKGYSTFVDFSFHLITCLTKFAAIDLFVFKRQKIEKLLQALMEYENHSVRMSTNKYMLLWNIPLIAITVSVAYPIVQAIFLTCSDLETTLLTTAHELNEDIFIWNSKMAENISETLRVEFATNLTVTSVAFGSLVILRRTASSIQLGVMLDLILCVAVVLYVVVFAYMRDIEKMLETNQDALTTTTSLTEQTRVWKQYRKLRNVVAYVNDVYDPILKLMHLSNLLMYAYFMTLTLFRDETNLFISIFYIWNLFKAELLYHFAGQIVEQNDKIRLWIRNCALLTGKVCVDNKQLDVTVLLDELDKEPIGLGKGTFLIQQAFHLKFLGLVGSAFFSLADEYKMVE